MIIAIIPGGDFLKCVVLIVFQAKAVLPDIFSYLPAPVPQGMYQGAFIADGIIRIPFFEVVGDSIGDIMLKPFFRG